jgi:hypothetical protein
MFKIGDIITTYDGTEYLICAIVKYRGKEYAYVSNYQNSNDCMICRVNIDGLIPVKNEELFNRIMDTLIENIDFNGIVNNIKQ